MKACRESRSIVPLILKLGTRGGKLSTAIPNKSRGIHLTFNKLGCDPDPIWTRWRREKYLENTGI